MRLDWVDPYDGTNEHEWIVKTDVVKAELMHEWTEAEMWDC
ncbi:hypothetical protein [Paenibacillus eucommiae]|uniref:Uncharacterized protein n=1 Tax=Paenibacillus eucommiae TaxID=1355755 RepID=A0ABS4IYQ8_9BACL|nr:hypothetical protein [Paenibacillus eucommiae]MBP1992727.1 hypothetical protein [Paenibacillus eucommiae]